ncbi:MAG: hypothetical protein ACREDH_14810, partial [Methylocella sp.]
MKIELPGQIAGLIDEKIMIGEQRPENLTKFRLADTLSPFQYKRGADALARALNQMRAPSPKPVKLFLISIADIRCLVPRCAGVCYGQLKREGLWDKFYMDAPARQWRCVEQSNRV